VPGGSANGDGLDRATLRVLIGNWRGGYTVPARGLYPHQWSWDSAFIAVGLRHLSARRAQRELETLFGAQWADGRIPHIVFDPATPPGAYFPGARFWRSAGVPGAPAVATSGLIQPPVHAIAAWTVFLADPAQARRRAFLPRLYPRLAAWHGYLLRRRRFGGSGLMSVVHPWESGMDNSPSWDEPLALVEPSAASAIERPDLAFSPAAHRPTDVDYGRYVRLAAAYRDSGYADRPEAHAFAVEDPLANSLLAAAEGALAEIAAEVGADPGPHRERAAAVAEALMTLYDDEAGAFFPRDLRTGLALRKYTIGGLVPLVVPGLPVAAALVKTALGDRFRLGDACPVPSYDLTAEDFDGTRYWRGPGWYNTSWLLWRGLSLHGENELADALRGGLLETVRRTGFREYVNPVTGQGCGTDEFGWTAAVALDLIHSSAPG
jgi:hypothetical protein